MKHIVLVVLAVSTGCSLSHGVQAGGPTGPGNKVVAGKEEPATLVATDGSICLVTGRRFSETKAGDRVWCNWMRRGGG